jgi:hypothetical protein
MKYHIFCTVSYIKLIFIRQNCYLTFYIKNSIKILCTKIQIQTLLLSSKSKFEQLTLLIWQSSFNNVISSFAIEQSSAEDVLAAGMLVLADDCTPHKCCIICSLTSYEKIKKFTPTGAENEH